MSTTCPCCGGEASPLDLLIDRGTGRIVYGGSDARLSVQEMRLFTALLDGYPSVISKEDLLSACAADERNEPEQKLVDVLVCKIRRKIDGLGLVITTSWGVGYRLELGEAEKAAVLRARRYDESRRTRTVLDRGDVAVVAMLRAQGLPITGIAQRLRLTFGVVTAAIDAIEAQKKVDLAAGRAGQAERRASA